MIKVESVQVEAKSKVVRVDEEAATLKANEAQALKNECESELAEAIPALEAALSALDTLKVQAKLMYPYPSTAISVPCSLVTCAIDLNSHSVVLPQQIREI